MASYKALRDFSGGSVTGDNYEKGKVYPLKGDFVDSWVAWGWIEKAEEKPKAKKAAKKK